MLDMNVLSFEPVGKIVNKYIGDRKLVLLGDNKNFTALLMQRYGIEPMYIATSVKDNLSKGDNYRMLSDFEGKSNEFYICIPFLKYDVKLVKRFNQMGFKEYTDFVFVFHKRITIPPHTKNYVDEYGNNILSSGDFSVVLIERAGDCIVDIKDSVLSGTNSFITMAGNKAKVIIEENVRFSMNTRFEVYSYSDVYIEEKSSFAWNFSCRVPACGTVKIGKDCMFSNDIDLFCGDGHAIFDIQTGRRLNECNIDNKTKIIIGNHVWVGLRCLILSSSIGKSSIIGARSVVKGKIDDNCIAVGNPAVVKKHDITWSRNNYAMDINECGEDYI